MNDTKYDCKECPAERFCGNGERQPLDDMKNIGLTDLKQKLWEKAQKLRNSDKRRDEKVKRADRICYYGALCLAFEYCNENGGGDYYTDRPIDWKKWGKIENIPDKPTIDHITAIKHPFFKNEEGKIQNNFAVCRGDVNDAKNSLSEYEFTELCIKFLRKKGFEVKKN